jgi:diguanylate cyclase (GGDEF)-like protein
LEKTEKQIRFDTFNLDVQHLLEHIDSLRQTNSILQNKIKELELILQVSSLLSQTLDKDEIIDSLKEFFRVNFLCDEFCLLLKTESEEKLEIISSFGFHPSASVWIHLAIPDGVLYQAFHEQKSVHITNLLQDYKYELRNHRDINHASLVVLPLLPVENRIIGLISLLRRQKKGFSASELTHLDNIVRYVAAIIDKTILFHNTKELAYTDSLTGIFNRRYFDQRYTREVLRARRYHRSLAILMIDIDHFKKYNDTFGHLLGDEILKKVATVFSINLRRADILCRYGGEEFVVILPESDLNHGHMVAEKLRKSLMEIEFDGEEHMPQRQLTISIGVSAYPETGNSEKDILAKADQALYEAKKSGRNRVVAVGASQV